MQVGEQLFRVPYCLVFRQAGLNVPYPFQQSATRGCSPKGFPPIVTNVDNSDFTVLMEVLAAPSENSFSRYSIPAQSIGCRASIPFSSQCRAYLLRISVYCFLVASAQEAVSSTTVASFMPRALNMPVKVSPLVGAFCLLMGNDTPFLPLSMSIAGVTGILIAVL